MEKLTTEQVLRALRRLEKGWPDNLEILVMDGTLNVVNRYPDEDEPVRLDAYGCADQSEVVDSFPGISADGGGW